jgi:hypothetical protein
LAPFSKDPAEDDFVVVVARSVRPIAILLFDCLHSSSRAVCLVRNVPVRFVLDAVAGVVSVG